MHIGTNVRWVRNRMQTGDLLRGVVKRRTSFFWQHRLSWVYHYARLLLSQPSLVCLAVLVAYISNAVNFCTPSPFELSTPRQYPSSIIPQTAPDLMSQICTLPLAGTGAREEKKQTTNHRAEAFRIYQSISAVFTNLNFLQITKS